MTELRCHSCSHEFGRAVRSVRLVIVFDPSEVGHIIPTHPQEIRKRCPSCEWVNVYKPIGALASNRVQTKPTRYAIEFK